MHKNIEGCEGKSWKHIPINLGYTSCKRNRGKVILKFVNRKFASTAISNRSNLKDIDDFANIHINSVYVQNFLS